MELNLKCFAHFAQQKIANANFVGRILIPVINALKVTDSMIVLIVIYVLSRIVRNATLIIHLVKFAIKDIS